MTNVSVIQSTPRNDSFLALSYSKSSDERVQYRTPRLSCDMHNCCQSLQWVNSVPRKILPIATWNENYYVEISKLIRSYDQWVELLFKFCKNYTWTNICTGRYRMRPRFRTLKGNKWTCNSITAQCINKYI